MTKTVDEFVAELRGNVDAWYAKEIDYDAFHARQCVTWATICDAGPAVHDEVRRVLWETR